jgi:hypothetical protein
VRLFYDTAYYKKKTYNRDSAMNVYIASAFVAAVALGGAVAWFGLAEAGWRLYALFYVVSAVEGLLVRLAFASTAAAGLKVGLLFWAAAASIVEAARIAEKARLPSASRRLFWLAALPAISVLMALLTKTAGRLPSFSEGP